MATKKCTQCAETVQRDAKVCRFCSFTFPAQQAVVKPKGGFLKVAGIVLGLLFLGSFLRAMHPADGSPDATASAEPTATATEAPLDPDAIAPALVGMSIKAAARDPDSLVIDKAWQNSKQTYVCVSYRAKNGFGGMNREHAVFTNKGGDQSSSAWNRKCTSDGLNDVTSLVKMGTGLSAP